MRFRKKPVVIEAYQFDGDVQAAFRWEASLEGVHPKTVLSHPINTKIMQVKSLEGTMRVDPGDWIIKGVNGELYSCKPDIFAKTYESEEDSAR